jgi:hypothetical protein
VAAETVLAQYRNESGTAYRSFEAFGSANLAKAYARRFAKGSKSWVGMAPSPRHQLSIAPARQAASAALALSTMV